jgi:hypothetical protein
MATLKFAVFCSSATLMCRHKTAGNCRRAYHYCCFYEAKKLCLRKLILFLFFSRQTPLHKSGHHLEVCRLLLECNADVDVKDMCFSPPPSHHLSLTICLAAVATLHHVNHSNGPATPHSSPHAGAYSPAHLSANNSDAVACRSARRTVHSSPHTAFSRPRSRSSQLHSRFQQACQRSIGEPQ